MNSQSTENCAPMKATEPDWELARRRGIERMLHARRKHSDESGTLNSYQGRLRRQRDLALWIVDREFDLLISINSTSPNFTYESGRTALRKFGELLDRCLLGKHWWRLPSQDRTLFFAVPEYAGGELHYHISVRLPAKAQREPNRVLKLRRVLTLQLRKKRIFPCGDADIKVLNEGAEIEIAWRQVSVACYVVKDLWQPDAWENCILSTEFHPVRN